MSRCLVVLEMDSAYCLKRVNVSMVGKDQLVLSHPALESWTATEEDSALDLTPVNAKKDGLVPTVPKHLAMPEGIAAIMASASLPISVFVRNFTLEQNVPTAVLGVGELNVSHVPDVFMDDVTRLRVDATATVPTGLVTYAMRVHQSTSDLPVFH